MSAKWVNVGSRKIPTEVEIMLLAIHNKYSTHPEHFLGSDHDGYIEALKGILDNVEIIDRIAKKFGDKEGKNK